MFMHAFLDPLLKLCKDPAQMEHLKSPCIHVGVKIRPSAQSVKAYMHEV